MPRMVVKCRGGRGCSGVSVGDEIEQLAWVVLRAANRRQAKSSTARLIVPRAPEVAEELGMDLTDAQFLSVEEYLQGHGYVVPADIGLTGHLHRHTCWAAVARGRFGRPLGDELVARTRP